MECPKAREYQKGIFRKNKCISYNFLKDRSLLGPDSRALSQCGRTSAFYKSIMILRETCKKITWGSTAEQYSFHQ